jgi:hypothetical protein
MSNPAWRMIMGGGLQDYVRRLGGPKLRTHDGQVFTPYGEDFVVYALLPEGPPSGAKPPKSRTIHVGMPEAVNEWLRDPKDHSFLFAMGMFAVAYAAVIDAIAKTCLVEADASDPTEPPHETP